MVYRTVYVRLQETNQAIFDAKKRVNQELRAYTDNTTSGYRLQMYLKVSFDGCALGQYPDSGLAYYLEEVQNYIYEVQNRYGTKE